MDRKSLAVVGLCGLAIAAAWGPLDPPNGPIASTYKTLAEVEPRIAVSAENTPGDAGAVYRIDKPGSYYLTRSFKGTSGKAGIQIDSSRVTLDLNGFSLEGVNGASHGVLISPSTGVTVRNGAIFNWLDGIAAGSATACRFEGIVSYSNSRHGFSLGDDAVVSGCTANVNSNNGFYAGSRGAVIRDCTASDNVESGFYLVGTAVTACTARNNGIDGFSVVQSAMLTDCSATENEGLGFYMNGDCRATRSVARNNATGFRLFEGSILVECTGVGSTLDGARIESNSNTIERCTFRENGRYGVHLLTGRGNSIDGNLCTYNTGSGVAVFDPDNLIVRNRARGNGGEEYVFDPNSDYGVVLTNPGQGFDSSAAWANFAY